MMLAQTFEQGIRKNAVPLHELCRIFRAVNTCQIEDKIRFGTIVIQLLGGRVYIILHHFFYYQITITPRFTITDIT